MDQRYCTAASIQAVLDSEATCRTELTRYTERKGLV